MHSTTPDEAEMFIECIGAVFPKDQIYRARIDPVIGTHLGPGTLAVALIEGER